jgi:hypothetical protein
MDEPAEAYGNFSYTEEYLDRKFPAQKDEIIDLLEKNSIYSDSDIAFDEKILIKFRDMTSKKDAQNSLAKILEELEIETRSIGNKEENRSNYVKERGEKLNKILSVLFQLATNWAVLIELEDKVDDYSLLNDEQVLRPDEEKNLDALDDTTSKSFNVISDLTKNYVKLLTDFYFNYGGNLALKDFVEELHDLKNTVEKKYYDLFKSHGLDTEWLSKLKD